ncbi:MAG: hypothetical protein LCI00_02050 [Chloroflexi bacterium]|nr:hypothetical protein [Chloroflexota bacterium]MCC6895527.1 hypothetical protein [Anaerolineae bacterium]
MKRLLLIAVVIVILIIGGGLSSQIASNGNQLPIPGLIRQTTDPDASALDMAPWKAEQLFLFVGFIIFNLVGMAVTIMAIVWFLNWQVKSANAIKVNPSTAVVTTTEEAT